MGSEVIILPSLFFMVGFIVYTVVDVFRRRQQTKVYTEFHSKLLDRMGSAKDLAEFFTSEAGNRFLSALASAGDAVSPQVRILRSLQTGLVLLALGIGLFMLTAQRQFMPDAADGLMVTATAAAAIGAALLVSTAISYVLSKRMGLIDRPPLKRHDTSTV